MGANVEYGDGDDDDDSNSDIIMVEDESSSAPGKSLYMFHVTCLC